MNHSSTKSLIKSCNGEVIECNRLYQITFNLGSDLFTHSFLAVPHLNVDAVLGVDFIDSLSFNRNKTVISINNKELALINHSLFEIGRANHSTFDAENFVHSISISNPYHTDKSITQILCEPINTNHKFNLDTILTNNTKNISMFVHDKSHDLDILRNTKICTLQPIKEQIGEINGISHVTVTADEVKNFHEERIAKFGKINNFEFGSVGHDLSTNQIEKLMNVFRDKELSLARNSKDIGKLFKFRYTLPLFDERETAYLPPRPVPPHLLEKVELEISKFKELDMIEPSESGFNIPLLILKKSDGTLRVSLDARQLNTKLIPDRFPLPSMPELLSKVSNRLSSKNKGCFVTALDVNKAYWQLGIDPADSHKVSFSFKNRHYKSKRMLYGLSTAPAAWSRIMMEIFGNNDKILIYLDDILIISTTFEEHLMDLSNFLELCIQNGLTIAMPKIKLCNTSFEFLGHHIDANGIRPKQSHIESINNFSRPTNKSELKRFLGMAQFNSRMVKDASVTLAPLHQLTSGRKPFVWNDCHQKAFDKIKNDLKQTTGLAHRNLSYPLVLSTDASLTHAGGTLYQKIPNGELQAVGYYSGVFSLPETRLSSRHREIIALSRGIKHFEFHLIGTRFTALVDHKSLLYLFREHYKTNLSTKLVNILVYLQNFDFDIVHCPGTSSFMASADYLSRHESVSLSELQERSKSDDLVDKIFIMSHFPCTEIPEESQKFLESLTGAAVDSESKKIALSFGEIEISCDEMIEMQKSCSFCQNIRRKLDIAAKSTFKNYCYQNNLLMRRSKNGQKLVLPEPKAFEFISYVHALYLHPGFKAMVRIINRSCFIPDVVEKCKLVTKNCLSCITKKFKAPLKSNIIKPKAYEAVPFSKVGIDLYDLGKADRFNKRYLFTLTDHLTGYIDGVPINSKCDQATSTAFSTLILRHGVCGKVILDNGKEFQGPIFQDLCTKFQLELHYSSPYNSRSNSRAERSHRDILVKQKLLGSNRRNWSTHWPFIQCILNNTPRENLNGLTSAECVYGRPTHYPLTFELATAESPKSDFSTAMNEYTRKLWPELLQLQLSRYAKLMNTESDKLPKLNVDDYVLCWKPKMVDGKLSTLWEGPYKIIKNYSNVSYHLVNPETGLKIRRHIRHLRPIGKIMNEKLTKTYSDFKNNNDPDHLEISKEGGDTEYSNQFLNELPFNDMLITTSIESNA